MGSIKQSVWTKDAVGQNLIKYIMDHHYNVHAIMIDIHCSMVFHGVFIRANHCLLNVKWISLALIVVGLYKIRNNSYKLKL